MARAVEDLISDVREAPVDEDHPESLRWRAEMLVSEDRRARLN